mmetsp:Transcript_53497/g.87525  ORF Transcript_53497/g.87525 Transcript_53497/m.87525 type:complete len:89 (+) Transcript_53497:437-703(+)
MSIGPLTSGAHVAITHHIPSIPILAGLQLGQYIYKRYFMHTMALLRGTGSHPREPPMGFLLWYWRWLSTIAACVQVPVLTASDWGATL